MPAALLFLSKKQLINILMKGEYKMETFYCLISDKDATDNPTILGWTYCNKHRELWVRGNQETDRYNTIGLSKGTDFVVHEGKVYGLRKVFQNLDEKITVILCVESVMACDN